MAIKNGKQLYGLRRLKAVIKMSSNKIIKKLSLKQKLGFLYALKEMKMTDHNDKIYTNTFTPYYPSKAYDRYLNGVVSITKGIPLPVIVNFAVTSKCICDCVHCSFSAREKKNELALDELADCIKQVQDMGTSIIGITGGEPLLRDDLEEIINSIGEKSMSLLFTTGFNLTQERVKALKKAGLDIPVISLDHYIPEIHDKRRKKTGMFDTALKAIKLFQDEGFYTAVSFVPGRDMLDNKNDFFKTIDFFKNLRINDMRLTSPILSGKLTDKPEEKLSKENIKTIFKAQKSCVKKKGYPGVFAYDYFENQKFYGCCAGYNYMFIDSSGNICPCDFTMISLGNIREKSIVNIWEEMNKYFKKPQCECIANTISNDILKINDKKRPLSYNNSIDIICRNIKDKDKKIPLFFKKMGLKINNLKK